jgi:hypothetical protein
MAVDFWDSDAELFAVRSNFVLQFTARPAKIFTCRLRLVVALVRRSARTGDLSLKVCTNFKVSEARVAALSAAGFLFPAIFYGLWTFHGKEEP